MSEKENNQIKKRIIVISCCMIVLLFISAIITATVLNFHKHEELNKEEGNILYYSENENQEEENVIIVGIEDKSETNENNTVDEQSTNQNNNQKAENNNTTQKADPTYYIKVNYQENVVTVYKKDSSGKYTVPVKAMLCSCGDYTPPCPKYPGTVYKIPDAKNTRFVWAKMQGDVWAQYATRITGNILFHSVPYTDKDKSSLEYWEYDKLGTTASLGCVRLAVKDAKWIYDNCAAGTTVEFYASSNPGSLGKPTPNKITDDEEVRGWDPTDSDKNNPWTDYLKKKKEEAEALEKQKEQEKAKEASTKPAEGNTTDVMEDDKAKNTITKIEINTNTTNTTNTTNVNSNKVNTVDKTNTVNNVKNTNQI